MEYNIHRNLKSIPLKRRNFNKAKPKQNEKNTKNQTVQIKKHVKNNNETEIYAHKKGTTQWTKYARIRLNISRIDGQRFF